jgi:hypothetical protein
MASFCKHGNEPLDSRKGRLYLEQLINYQIKHWVNQFVLLSYSTQE